jgi:spore germination protein KA
VALMMEGTPTALTLPYIFIEYFQTVEDYTNNFWMASIARIMRIIGYILTLTVPAVYLALVSMHQEMVPTDLLLAINASRQQVPLPAVLEIIIMLIVVEIMRESGARVPSFLGQSLSIVGGLVIGQAAVEARLVSAPVVIVVALTAITSLLIPKIEGAAFILRIGFLLITSVLGFYGLMIGMTAMFIHLLGIRSFGVPYLSAIFPLNMQEFKDTAIRMPWYYMVLRPRHISKKDSVRQSGRKV